jgi:putative endonuclease
VGRYVVETRSGYGSACQHENDPMEQVRLRLMNAFHYVYILESVHEPTRYYTGCTEDLKERLLKHNHGEVPHTSKHKLWQIKTALAFRDRERAIAFEAYLKSASGRAFAKKRL